MKSLKRWNLLLCAAVLTAGCATMVHGTTQKIKIDSSPEGANVKVDEVPVGTTPTSIELSRASSHTVAIEKEGYLPRRESITQGGSGWVFGNIVAGGLVGICIDLASGGAYELSPEQVSSSLIACGPSDAAKPAPDVTVLEPAPATNSATQ